MTEGSRPQAGREKAEREAALKRGHSLAGQQSGPLCAPEVNGLRADLLYTLVAENVRDYAIFLLDRDGIIRCWGEGARLMKWWTKQQAEGAHLRLLYPDGGAEDGTAEAHLDNAAETGEYNGEGHRVRSDGSTFWAYVTLTALRSEDGTLVGFTKVTRDFSARRALESALVRERGGSEAAQQMLAEANRMKHLLANLSHELRTPLAAILNTVAIIEHSEVGAQEREHLERLRRNSRHLLSMVDDVLEMSRAELRDLPLASATHRLGGAVVEALADVAVAARNRDVTIVNSVSGGAAELPYWGDQDRVRQIVVNLLTNAAKFTDPGGRVTISGGTAEEVAGARLGGPRPWVYLRVEDNGRGIAADRLELVFEPFHQVEAGDKRRGTGLGLAISRRLARLMGGDLVAESELGVGSRFTLWLPITAATPIPA